LNGLEDTEKNIQILINRKQNLETELESLRKDSTQNEEFIKENDKNFFGLREELKEIEDKLGNKKLFHPSSASKLPETALFLHRHTSFLRDELFQEIEKELLKNPGRSELYTNQEISNAINYLAGRSSEATVVEATV
jgi:hypothetical protein